SAIEGLIATSKAELRKADEELKVVKEALEKAAPEILRRSVEGLTAPTIAAMTDELEDVQGRYTMAMSDFQKQISDPLNADDDRQKEINAKRLDSTRKYTEDSLRILDKYIEQAKEKSESSDPAIKRAGERMLAEFHQRRLDLMREVGQEVQAADAPDIPDTFANLQDASLGQGEDEATRAYNSLINKQKELEAQADRVRKALGSDDTEIDPLGLKALQAELDGTLTQLKGYPEEAKAKLFSTDVRRDNAVVKMGDLAMDLRNKTRDMNFAMVDDPQLRSQMELQHEEQRVERMLSLLQGEGAERKLIEEDVQNYLQALRERAERNSETSAQRVAREWSNVNQRLRDAGAGWMNEFSNMLMDFVKTGKLKFSEFAEHILLEIIRIRMESMIAKPLSSLIDAAIGWLGGAIGGLSTGSEAPKISAPTPLVPSIPTVAGPPTFGIGYIYHAGGIVSRDTRPLRLLDPALFAGAGRFHGGGFPGLRSDEVPIIARKGEGVFTPEQMRALGGRGGGSDVTLNIINQTGTTVQAEQQGQRFDGERMILDVVLKHAARPGQFRDAMKGAFG
ncbi:MAG TPA: phage tail tape measure C-terminal domain-containing protein, partial [Kaistia sp.]|nr:phage tail tape measure C-terminal domain-containing protein [Kaistia sp.]